MKIKNMVINTVMVSSLGVVSMNADAALTTGTLLSINAGQFTCTLGPSCDGPYLGVTGSWMALDIYGDGVIDPVDQAPLIPGTDGGIILGQTQMPGEIDDWTYLAVTGNGHYTTSPINVVNDMGATKELDFSGWNYQFNGFGGPVGDVDNFGDSLLATISCETAACAHGEAFTLEYTAHIPVGDPVGFGGVLYGLHLEGTISAVPVPAAVWLFGSGLIGLAGFARKK